MSIVFGLLSALAAAGAGGAVTAQLGSTWRERRAARGELAAVPLLTAEIPDGAVARTTGIVRGGDELLQSPLGGWACVAYRLRASVRSRSSAPPFENAAVTEFLVRGADGDVLVRGTHARLAGARRRIGRVDPARRGHVLRANGHHDTESLTGVAEHVIAVDDEVEVIGVVMREAQDAPPSGEIGFRDAGPPLVILAGDAAHPLLILKR